MVAFNRHYKNIVKQINLKTSHNIKTVFIIFIYIIYGLYLLENPQNRYTFKKKYTLLNKIYEKIIRLIGTKISIEVKQCKRCGILFIPDYRVQKRQHNCPYGCVLENRKEIIKRAKYKNRKLFSTRKQHSENNRAYRERMKKGLPTKTTIRNTYKPYPYKLEKYILYIYQQTNQGNGKEDLEKISVLLQRAANYYKNGRDPIFTKLEKYVYKVTKQWKMTVKRRE